MPMETAFLKHKMVLPWGAPVHCQVKTFCRAFQCSLKGDSPAEGFDLCQVAWKAIGGARVSGSPEAFETMVVYSSGRS